MTLYFNVGDTSEERLEQLIEQLDNYESCVLNLKTLEDSDNLVSDYTKEKSRILSKMKLYFSRISLLQSYFV